MERLFAFEVSNVQTMERPAGTYDAEHQLWAGAGEVVAIRGSYVCNSVDFAGLIQRCIDAGGQVFPMGNSCIYCF